MYAYTVHMHTLKQMDYDYISTQFLVVLPKFQIPVWVVTATHHTSGITCSIILQSIYLLTPGYYNQL